MPVNEDARHSERGAGVARALVPYTFRWLLAGILGALLVLALVAAVRLAIGGTPAHGGPRPRSPVATAAAGRSGGPARSGRPRGDRR